MSSPRVSHGIAGRTIVAGCCRLTEAAYAPGQRVGRHEHALPSWTYVVSGALEETFSFDSIVCGAGMLLSKPATADHANQYGSRETRCLLIEVASDCQMESTIGANLFSAPTLFSGGLVPTLGAKIYSEFNHDDRIAAFSLECLLVELRVAAARLSDPSRVNSTKKWLNRVRDHLEAEFRSPPSLKDLASAHDLHPVYICQEFGAAFGMSMGEYVRRVRFAWAREAVGATSVSIADIALAAGYSDQAHLCRDFRKRMALSPNCYRNRIVAMNSLTSRP
jgi:AraC family transcriptional regulator